MKTNEILSVYQYNSVGGPIDAIPVSDVIAFCRRIEDRLDDIDNGMSTQFVKDEIKEVTKKLENKC